MNVSVADLLGTWDVDPTDEVAIQQFGNVSMEFTADGVLRYVIEEAEDRYK